MHLSMLFRVWAEGGDKVLFNGVKGNDGIKGNETVRGRAGMVHRAWLLVASGVGSEGR